MDSYLEQKRKEDILKINLELDKAPPNYRNLISDLIKVHCSDYCGLLKILLNKKYSIKNYQVYDKENFYRKIKFCTEFFRRIYQIYNIEITLIDYLKLAKKRELYIHLYNSSLFEIDNRRKINFDFNTMDYLYIIFIYNTIKKQFEVAIYNGLPEREFIYLVNHLDKLC